MRCLTTRVTGIDQPPLHMMQMFYYVVNDVHVDYVALIWEGFHYSLMHPTTVVPYPRFIKLILDYILTTYPDIPKRTSELHHYVINDEVVQSIFNSEKVKGIGINRTLSTPRSPNPQEKQQGESSAPNKPIIIKIPKRKQPDPKTPILTAAHIDLENLTEAQVLSYTLAKSAKEYETQQNVKCVEEHLLDEDVNKLVEGEESDANQFADDMVLSQEDPYTRIDPWSHKESPEVKKVDEYVSVDEEVEEETADVELIQMKGKGSLEIKDTTNATPTRSPRTESLSLDKEKL
ncbi:hypothetical protein Tco_0324004 [Tanacetum coccineum]